MEKKEEVCQRLAAALLDFMECVGGEARHMTPHPRREETEIGYTPAEISEKLKVSQDTVRRWIRDGKFGETVSTGRHVLVTQSGLQYYLENNTGTRTRTQTNALKANIRAPQKRVTGPI